MNDENKLEDTTETPVTESTETVMPETPVEPVPESIVETEPVLQSMTIDTLNSDVTNLHFDKFVSVSINGKTYEGTDITVPNELVDSVRQNLFDAQDITEKE